MPDPTCALGRLDQVLLAWAAGFFDGEGSTIVYECRPGYLRLTTSVPQFGGAHPPEVLLRFQRAMLDLGEITPHNNEGMWAWRSRSAEEAYASIALLWSQLGSVKKAQASSAIRRFRAQYGLGGLVPRAPRRRRASHTDHIAPPIPALSDPELDHAWLAGFLDGEGCFTLIRDGSARKNGPTWLRVRASITQRNELPGPPDVLFRVQGIVGDGRIERHGDPHAYKWVVEGAERISKVLSLTEGWLGRVKLDQATSALETFNAQPRLKGDATHCKRGHAYDHAGTRPNGRPRKMCNACGRILSRIQSASQGIRPRQFRNVARRYTF